MVPQSNVKWAPPRQRCALAPSQLSLQLSASIFVHPDARQMPWLPSSTQPRPACAQSMVRVRLSLAQTSTLSPLHFDVFGASQACADVTQTPPSHWPTVAQERPYALPPAHWCETSPEQANFDESAVQVAVEISHG